jgi:hypothetical protein
MSEGAGVRRQTRRLTASEPPTKSGFVRFRALLGIDRARRSMALSLLVAEVDDPFALPRAIL